MVTSSWALLPISHWKGAIWTRWEIRLLYCYVYCIDNPNLNRMINKSTCFAVKSIKVSHSDKEAHLSCRGMISVNIENVISYSCKCLFQCSCISFRIVNLHPPYHILTIRESVNECYRITTSPFNKFISRFVLKCFYKRVWTAQ